MSEQPDQSFMLGPPRDSIPLIHRPTGQSVSARLVRLASLLAHRSITCRWWRNLDVPPEVLLKEEDHHWDWKRESGKVANSPDFGCYAALTTDDEIDEIQGAII